MIWTHASTCLFESDLQSANLEDINEVQRRSAICTFSFFPFHKLIVGH